MKKKMGIVLLVFMMGVLLLSCEKIPEEAQQLIDQVETIDRTRSSNVDLYIWGRMGTYTRNSYRLFNADFPQTNVNGFIDCQDNFGYFYSTRNSETIGIIYEGRSHQLLKSEFVDDEIETIELEETNTRDLFLEKVKDFGFFVPTYGDFSYNPDGTITFIKTELKTIYKKNPTFLTDVLRLTETEIDENLDEEVVIEINLSLDDRIIFDFNIDHFLRSDKDFAELYSELDYRIDVLIRETMTYDINLETIPNRSFPSDYLECDIAYQVGSPINMIVNPNGKTYVNMELEAGDYNIHFAGEDTGVTKLTLYDESFVPVDYEQMVTIEVSGIYYYEIESDSHKPTEGKLFMDPGLSADYANSIAGTISSMSPDESRDIELISYAPTDGYLYFSGASYYNFMIYLRDVGYYHSAYGTTLLPVEKGERVTIRLVSRTDHGSGFLNWEFVLEEPND